MNEKISGDWKEKIQWGYNPHKRRVTVTLRPMIFLDFKDSKLAHILGFRPLKFYRTFEHDMQTFEGEKPPDLKFGRYAMFVYTDISEAVAVGDAHVPLLRIVPIEGSNGDIVTKTYIKPHYVPIHRNSFDTIEIHISDDMGEFFDFKYGKVICKLHLRPRKLQYL